MYLQHDGLCLDWVPPPPRDSHGRVPRAMSAHPKRDEGGAGCARRFLGDVRPTASAGAIVPPQPRRRRVGAEARGRVAQPRRSIHARPRARNRACLAAVDGVEAAGSARADGNIHAIADNGPGRGALLYLDAEVYESESGGGATSISAFSSTARFASARIFMAATAFPSLWTRRMRRDRRDRRDSPSG